MFTIALFLCSIFAICFFGVFGTANRDARILLIIMSLVVTLLVSFSLYHLFHLEQKVEEQQEKIELVLDLYQYNCEDV